MSVDQVPPVIPEDWGSYECVFKFGDEDDNVSKLDKAVIRTNWEEHSLKFFFAGFSGVTNFPELIGAVMVDGVEVVHYDSNIKRAEPKQDWMKRLMEDDPGHRDWYTDECRVNQHFLNSTIDSLMKFNQTGDIHTFQRIYGCEWEDQVYTSDEYRYDGEGFMEFNPITQTWIPSTHPQASYTKLQWDRDKERIKNIILHLTNCSDWLKKYLDYANNTLKRTELPSVSLLQKTPSSPVSCHATGFYPDSATLIWRKDGVELHEDVNHGEILLNHDGSFQMSVDLDLHSSVTPEDWRKYDCVFQLSGVKNDIVIKLDKAVIRTNWGKPEIRKLPSVSLLQKTPSSPVSCHATGFYPDSATLIWRKDGVELHEDVDHGEILPNHDESFQMSVDLNLSSVPPEDWRRYDCVFQLYGGKNDIVTKLDKAEIRTNWEDPIYITIKITARVVVLAVVLIGAIGFIVYEKKKAPENSSELSEKLNPETSRANTPPCTQ
uniref:Ig-like domain-containing protein n=1 Tax=Dicentrarchus labrax TaxID=13489 RepID=A0A8C4E1J4_DICLA